MAAQDATHALDLIGEVGALLLAGKNYQDPDLGYTLDNPTLLDYLNGAENVSFLLKTTSPKE